jgi:hypothetical protein
MSEELFERAWIYSDGRTRFDIGPRVEVGDHLDCIVPMARWTVVSVETAEDGEVMIDFPDGNVRLGELDAAKGIRRQRIEVAWNPIDVYSDAQ